MGAEAIVVPAANGAEAALAGEIEVLPLESLAQLPALAAGEWRPQRPEPLPLQLTPGPGGPDLADLRGQRAPALRARGRGGGRAQPADGRPARRRQVAGGEPAALDPAAAGGGGGARGGADRQRLRSARGPSGGPARSAPRTTRSRPAGLIGGGNPPRPGEATLAHRGVLFLDELCEFRRDTLEALRAPLEAGWVSIARAGASRRLPCRFMLVAAANPCPCGRGESDPECSCAPLDVQSLPGQAERRPRRPHRPARRRSASRAPRRSAARRARLRPPSASGSRRRASARSAGSGRAAATPR